MPEAAFHVGFDSAAQASRGTKKIGEEGYDTGLSKMRTGARWFPIFFSVVFSLEFAPDPGRIGLRSVIRRSTLAAPSRRNLEEFN